MSKPTRNSTPFGKKLPEARFAQLRAEQRDWVEYRDHLASSPTFSGEAADEAAAKNSPGDFSTAASLTESRTLWLRGIVSKAPQESMTGKWRFAKSFGVLDTVGVLCAAE